MECLWNLCHYWQWNCSTANVLFVSLVKSPINYVHFTVAIQYTIVHVMCGKPQKLRLQGFYVFLSITQKNRESKSSALSNCNSICEASIMLPAKGYLFA